MSAIAELLPWLNLLLLPALGMLAGVSRELGAIMATQRAHDKRLDLLESARS